MKGCGCLFPAAVCFLMAVPLLSAGAEGNAAYRQAKEKALGWLASQMVPNDTVPKPEFGRAHLVLSYRIPGQDPASRFLSGRSMTYDNALASIAFTMAGDYQRATRILNTLARLVQADGSLWFGYNTQDSWPSEADASGALERTGATAWAGYAAVFYLLQRQKENSIFIANDRESQSYLKMAKSIAAYLMDLMVKDRADPRFGLVTGGNNGYSLQYDSTGVVENFQSGAIAWASTEHNIDAWFFLNGLGVLTGEKIYQEAASKIRAALLKLWSRKNGQYRQGVESDRVDEVMALDCASWGSMFSLAAGKGDYAASCLKSVERKYRSRDTVPASGGVSAEAGVEIEGYKPYESRPVFDVPGRDVFEYYYGGGTAYTWKEMNGVWAEGSLGVALAYLKQGKTEKTDAILGEVLKLQDADGGVRYFTRQIPHEFVDYPSVASTAWLVIVLFARENAGFASAFMGGRK